MTGGEKEFYEGGLRRVNNRRLSDRSGDAPPAGPIGAVRPASDKRGAQVGAAILAAPLFFVQHP